jgi:hypothetical protein
MKKILIKSLKIIGIVAIFSLGFSFSLAWTGPTGAPTSSNTLITPVDTSNTNQIKGTQSIISSLFHTEGVLSSNALAVFGNSIFSNTSDGLVIESLSKVNNPTITYPANVCIDNTGVLYICSAVTTFTLNVAKSGTGLGTITSSPSGINCGIDCTENYDSGKQIVLTATATTGSRVDSWTGCNSIKAISTTIITCTVDMNYSKNVIAQFTLNTNTVYSLQVTKNGGFGLGTVTSDTGGINCASNCMSSSAVYPSQTVVTLTATPASGSTFTNWTGCDSTTGTVCTVTMSSSRTVNALFSTSSALVYKLNVSKDSTGTGMITSDSGGISCGVSCSANYASGKKVVLTAVADSDSSLTGASGCNTFSGGVCSVTMSSVKNVIFHFKMIPPPTVPSVTTTTPVTNINTTYATGGGTINSNGGASVIGSGITWSKTSNPTYSPTNTDQTTDGWQIGGPWTSQMIGLIPNTTYHVRAYARNNVGVGYGNDVTFTTSSTTYYSISILKNGTGLGTVTSNTGGINCGAVCFASYSAGTSVVLTPTANSDSVFTSWTGCTSTSGTNNSICTVKLTSSNKTVTAKFSSSVSITTSSVTNIGQTSATGGGIVSGATTSVQRGIVIGLSSNPAVNGVNRIFDGGSGNGTFSVNMTGLMAGTTYHARAYVQGPIGLIYGNDVSFTTNPLTYLLTVTKSGTGSGTATSSPVGINCGADCNQSYNKGTVVNITVPLSTTINSWTGCDLIAVDAHTCSVNMNSARNVNIVF